MLKRFLSLLIALCLALGCAVAETAEPKTHTIEKKAFPFYAGDPSARGDDEFPLYFVDGVNDLPFVELNDWVILMNQLLPTSNVLNTQYHLEAVFNAESGMYSMIRENDSVMTFDFNEGTLMVTDYAAFTQAANGPYMDVSGVFPVDQNGLPNLLIPSNIRVRHGGATHLNLKDYGIPMILQDGSHLMPLQTLTAFLLYPYGIGMYFNQESLCLGNMNSMKTPMNAAINDLMGLVTPEINEKISAMGLSGQPAVQAALEAVSETEEGKEVLAAYREAFDKSLYKLYADVEVSERSEALALFGFHELVLELDCFYGLKDAHQIKDFAEYLFETDLFTDLVGTSVEAAETAVGNLVNHYLDDGHSAFISTSHLQPIDQDDNSVIGFSGALYSTQADALSGIRQKYPEACQPYYEVGNTAYVRMDSFDFNTEFDYYAAAENGTLPDPTKDTVSLLVQAHQQITRENSPIENVVLDLSTNGGGDAPAAIFTIAWFLGSAKISIHDTFNGAETTIEYRADLNLDHQFDEKDTVSNLNLFCLTSPVSFSCGNLVPWAFKENGGVTLIGRVTGGGSCVVLPMTTAWGTTFQISGTRRISFLKNGAYYDVDQGVEPDYIIRSYEHFFDRQALTDYINSLF
ncbi:MAG: hypothetical protein IJ174_08930 [Clostridia bacterium]|nr:hypothetical protein [Clostridia bacterium]